MPENTDYRWVYTKILWLEEADFMSLLKDFDPVKPMERWQIEKIVKLYENEYFYKDELANYEFLHVEKAYELI